MRKKNFLGNMLREERKSARIPKKKKKNSNPAMQQMMKAGKMGNKEKAARDW